LKKGQTSHRLPVCRQVQQVQSTVNAPSRMRERAAMTKPAARAVVSDDGETIRLILYGEDGAVATVTLAPVRAIALAGELIEAALLRLSAT
jgi:hypothetical protein